MEANGQRAYNLDSNQETADAISIEQLRHLVRLLDASDVSEVEVRRTGEGTRLVLRKAKAGEGSDYSGQVVAPVAEAVSTAASAEDRRHFVLSSLVGIFHTWAKPRGGAVVAVGDRLKVGQLVGTIQSLNVINEVETTVAGRVTEILVQDGQPVEYGQQLVAIDPEEG